MEPVAESALYSSILRIRSFVRFFFALNAFSHSVEIFSVFRIFFERSLGLVHSFVIALVSGKWPRSKIQFVAKDVWILAVS
jgi:hypothetical protein